MDHPSLCIVIPVKDAGAHLPRLVENLLTLQCDPGATSLHFLEGDSKDGSYEILKDLTPRLEARFSRVSVRKFDQGEPPYRQDLRRERTHQLERRARIARARNRLLAGSLDSEDYVLWIDADMYWWPDAIYPQLRFSDAEVVTPHCTTVHEFRSFDLNTFKFRDGMKDPDEWLIDGIYQPPAGGARLYLHDLQDLRETPLDSVGGTMLLVKADAHRQGLIFPEESYEGYIETEGLARMAIRMGMRCAGLPGLRVAHG